jgi:SAM-dependent methyltransferase
MVLTPNSYSSQRSQVPSFIRESYNLYRRHSRDIKARVDAIVSNLRSVERLIKDRFGLELRNRSILDIGCGQYLTQLVFFSRFNRAVGIDWDVIPQSNNPLPYVSMLMANGARRTIKTVGRKLLGIDQRHRAEVMDQLKLKSLPKLAVHRMDACKMTFPDNSFDFVHSYSVFHHLRDPEAAVYEIVRVLKNGGVSYLSFHLFTSETGGLNFRTVRNEQGEVVRWPHLRSAFVGQVRSNAFLNKLRLHEWQKLFEKHMPESEVTLNRDSRPELQSEAESLVRNGELSGYSLEELLVHDVTILWRKPPSPAT